MSPALKMSFLFFCAATSYAQVQRTLTLSGKVIDQETGKPLDRASVTLKGSTINTVTNEEGAFIFYIPGINKNDTLHISVMGYQPFAIPLQKIMWDETLLVELTFAPLDLQAITITEDLTPEDILRVAIDRIPQNYYSKPFIQKTFYREVQKTNGRYVSLVEAAIEIYSKDHHRRGQKVKVLQLRRSKGYKHATHSFWNTYNVFFSALGLSTVGYISKKSMKEYTLQRQPNTTLNGKPVFVLTTATPAFWPAKFFIQCDNFAFVRIEETFDVHLDGEKSWKQHNNDTIDVFAQERKLVMEYKPFPEKYSLSTLRHTARMIYKGAYTGEQLLDFTIQQDFLINDIQVADIKTIRREEAFRPDTHLEGQPFEYDPEFWKAYNVIRETPLQEQIRKDLEKEMTLEEQFKSNRTDAIQKETKKSHE